MGNQSIYNFYRGVGMTHAGALAMLGNGFCESNNISYRVQGDFSANLDVSKTYTKRVDNGEIGRNQFVYNGPGGGGYGIYQWTWSPRKDGLYSFAKDTGRSIGDERMQLEYSVKELKRDFPALWRMLCSTDDLHSAVNDVCYLFENPAVKNVEARYRAALNIEKTLEEYKPEPEGEVYWPPRTVDKGMTGPDIAWYQASLICHGYPIGGDTYGIFGDGTDAAVRRFQADNGLDSDGVAGPMTRAKLAEMR